MKLNSRFLILITVLIFSVMGTINTQGGISGGSDITPQVNEVINISYFTNLYDDDGDGVDDTVDLQVDLNYDFLNGSMVEIFIDVFDANNGTIYLDTYSNSFFSALGNQTWSEYWSYQSPVEGTLWFSITVDYAGAFYDSRTFFVYNLDQFIQPTGDYTYATNPFDRDGDTLIDSITIWMFYNAYNTYGWIDLIADFYWYNVTTANYQYTTTISESILSNSSFTGGTVELQYNSDITGNFRINLYMYVNGYSVNSTEIFWNNVYIDSTPPPLLWDSNITLLDNDPVFGSDSYSLEVRLDLYQFTANIEIYAYLYQTNGTDDIYINDYSEIIQLSNGTFLYYFDGVFPTAGDYYFDIWVYANDEWQGSQRIDIFGVYRYSTAYGLLEFTIDEYDNDADLSVDTIDVFLELTYLNLFGQLTIDYDVFWWNSTILSWEYLETVTRIVDVNGDGTIGDSFLYFAPMDGDYEINVSVWLGNTYVTSDVIYWNNVFAYLGGERLDIQMVWRVENRDGLDDKEDTIIWEFNIDYSLFEYSEIKIWIDVYYWDDLVGDWILEQSNFEYLGLAGEGNQLFSMEYMAERDGDYRFDISYYLRGEIHGNIANEWYGVSAYGGSKASKLEWEVFPEGQDLDLDGLDDTLKVTVRFTYDNIPDTQIEIFASLSKEGQEIETQVVKLLISGNGDNDKLFSYTADSDGLYQFTFEIKIDGELVGNRVIEWDLTTFVQDDTVTPSDDDNSVTPALPLPAGNIYLFVVAILSSAILLRRRNL